MYASVKELMALHHKDYRNMSDRLAFIEWLAKRALNRREQPLKLV